jgi:hypothetical protein
MATESSYAIDRFEGDWAVLEDDDTITFNIPRRWLPSEARQGDIVKLVQEERGPQVQLLRLELDPSAKADRLERALRLRNEIPHGPKGDISM